MERGRSTLVILLCAALVLAVCVLALAGCGEKKEEASESSGTNTGTTGTGSGDAAQVSSCQANLRTINAAVQTYEAGEGKKPANIQALVPKYLKSIPKEPTGGTYSISGGKAVCSKGHTY